MMRWLIPWVMIGALSGCAASTDGGDQTDASVQVVFSSAMCGTQIQAPQVTWIDTPVGLRRAFDRFHTQQMPPSSIEPPPLDFTRYAAVLLEMGVQPSAGYGLTLQARRWSVAGDTLILRVNWLAPPPGRVFAQVITHPCLLVSVPRGGYRHIEILDQHGTVRMRADTRVNQ